MGQRKGESKSASAARREDVSAQENGRGRDNLVAMSQPVDTGERSAPVRCGCISRRGEYSPWFTAEEHRCSQEARDGAPSHAVEQGCTDDVPGPHPSFE